jgi:hypothetical protein
LQPDEFSTLPDPRADWLAGYRAALDHVEAVVRTDPNARTAAAGYRNAVGAEVRQTHEAGVTRTRWLETNLLTAAKDAVRLAKTAAKHAVSHEQTRDELAAANAEIARLQLVIASSNFRDTVVEASWEKP